MGVVYYLCHAACVIITLSIGGRKMELENLPLKDLIELAEQSTPASYAMIQREFARRAITETTHDASETYVNPPEPRNDWYVIPGEQN